MRRHCTLFFTYVQEDSKFYKLELQNRDKNYNEVFGRTPTVGVMQVRMLWHILTTRRHNLVCYSSPDNPATLLSMHGLSVLCVRSSNPSPAVHISCTRAVALRD